MRRSHIVTVFGVVLMLIGLGVHDYDANTQQSADINQTIESPTIIVTTEPTSTMLAKTSTVEPQPTPTVHAQSVGVGQLVWQDSFDNTASGWEPFYTAASDVTSVNYTAYNGYENGNYRFVLNSQMQNYDERQFLLWDFNVKQSLPRYPYAVEVDVRATRDHIGALILDYRGDVGNLDNGDGVFVRFHLGEAPTSPRQAWGLIGIEQGASRLFSQINSPLRSDLYALEVYESVAGRRYTLACNQLVMPLYIRTVTLRVEMDAARVNVVLIDRNNSTNIARITCNRIPANASAISSPAYVGLAGIYTARVVPVEIDYALDFEEIRVMSIDGLAVSSMDITQKPYELIDTDCETEFAMSMRSRLVSYNDDPSFCGTFGDWGVFQIGIIRYEPKVDQLIGRWQCGNDPEGVIEIFKQDWRMVIRFINQELLYLYAVDDAPVGGNQPHLILLGTTNVQPGDSIAFAPEYFLAYTDTDLVASWAGKCTRAP